MTAQYKPELGDGVIVNPDIAIRCYAAEQQPDSYSLYTANLTSFLLMEALEEHYAASADTRDNHSQEYLHLDAKVNLLIDLVGQLLSQQTTLPQPQPVYLSVQGIAWQASDCPQAGDRVVIELFLDDKHGRSIKLPGTLQDPENGLCKVMFDELDETLRSHFEKWIFRVHRREIAQLRDK